MKWVFIFLVFIALSSCKESRKDEIARLVKEWDGKEIRFPEHPVFTIQGEDTVDFSFRDAEYKVVSYVDSIGCISCKLQLANWAAFIQEVDSLTNGTVPFVFCLHTADVKEMKRIVRKDNFKYPVFLDEMGTSFVTKRIKVGILTKRLRYIVMRWVHLISFG